MVTAAQDASRTGHLRRFTLRTVFALVSIACLACGWEANRLHRRACAVAFLKRWHIAADDAYDSKSGWPWRWLPEYTEYWFYPWRVSYLGVYRDSNTAWARPIPTPAGSDALAQRVWGLPTCHRPSASERRDILGAIATLSEMGGVRIPFDLDDDELRFLAPLENLGLLAFWTPRLTASGVGQIGKFRGIYRLIISSDNPRFLTPGALAALADIPQLDDLFINAPLRKEAIEHIQAKLPCVNVCVPAPLN